LQNMAQFAAAGAAAVAIGTQVGSGFAAAKVIRLENQTNKKIHFSSNWKSIDVDASRHCDVDWAYAVLGVFGTVPDVTIRWTTNEGDYSQRGRRIADPSARGWHAHHLWTRELGCILFVINVASSKLASALDSATWHTIDLRCIVHQSLWS